MVLSHSNGNPYKSNRVQITLLAKSSGKNLLWNFLHRILKLEAVEKDTLCKKGGQAEEIWYLLYMRKCLLNTHVVVVGIQPVKGSTSVADFGHIIAYCLKKVKSHGN